MSLNLFQGIPKSAFIARLQSASISIEFIDSISFCFSSFDFCFNSDCNCKSEQFLLMMERCSSISSERCLSVLLETESEPAFGTEILTNVCGYACNDDIEMIIIILNIIFALVILKN